ncbi:MULTISPECIES: hypothetical protein [unclassified Azospirillum]|uniref:hypothetical protein n=1 Tax=unclassified Azospirillum TaxID=2630922 RepID=UPI0011777030|nr:MULTISPECIES: hypothetical protein [unclassified Azospirillum]
MTYHLPIGRPRPARPTRLLPEDRLEAGPILDAEWWEDEPAAVIEPLPPQRAQRHRPPDRAGHQLACTAYRQAAHFYA